MTSLGVCQIKIKIVLIGGSATVITSKCQLLEIAPHWNLLFFVIGNAVIYYWQYICFAEPLSFFLVICYCCYFCYLAPFLFCYLSLLPSEKLKWQFLGFVPLLISGFQRIGINQLPRLPSTQTSSHFSAKEDSYRSSCQNLTAGYFSHSGKTSIYKKVNVLLVYFDAFLLVSL